MASVPQTATGRTGRRFDPSPGRVRYSQRWLGAGAGAAALAAAAIGWGGLPVAGAFGVASLAGAAYTLFVEPRSPRLERISLRFANLPAALDGLRIGQISDTHLGHRFAAENTRWAVRQLMAEAPEIIAFTGDFVSFADHIAELPALLAPLRAPLGMFAVPGNHDHWEGQTAIEAALAQLGVEFLINRQRRLRWGDATITVAGVDDIWEGKPDLDAALTGTAAGGFNLLLCHAPDMADEAAMRGVDLQLSGHTHGGHLRLPGLGAFVLPRHGWRYAVGQAQVGQMQLYVSRGLGGVPMRFGCPPEATIITLQRSL